MRSKSASASDDEWSFRVCPGPINTVAAPEKYLEKSQSSSSSKKKALPVYASVALLNFQKSHKVLCRPHSFYSKLSVPELKDVSYKDETVSELSETVVGSQSQSSRPEIMQSYHPTYDWKGGVENVYCKSSTSRWFDGDLSQCDNRVRMHFSGLNLSVGIAEPLFCEIFLFDLETCSRVSESFYWNPTVDTLTADHLWGADQKSRNRKDPIARCRDAIFSISEGVKDVYFIARILKVLEGDPRIFTERYCKPSPKNMNEILAASKENMRLRDYRQLLCWTAVPCFRSGSASLRSEQIESGFMNLYALPKASSLSSDDLIRDAIVASVSVTSSKRASIAPGASTLKRVPGSITVKCEILIGPRLQVLIPTSNEKILSSSLSLIRDIQPEETGEQKNDTLDYTIKSSHTVIREVLSFPEFAQIAHFNDEPHPEYVNCLFVYPGTVSFESKYRNIACSIQVKSDYSSDSVLRCIHSRNDDRHLADIAHTTVVYHDRSPSFVDEIKIELPRKLTATHHILFRFYNIKCADKKVDPKQLIGEKARSTIRLCIGYAVLPLFVHGRLRSHEYTLPVRRATTDQLADYGAQCADRCGTETRALLSVRVRAHSSVYTSSPGIARFFQKFGGIQVDAEQSDLDHSDTHWNDMLHCGQVKQLKVIGASGMLLGFARDRDRWVVLQLSEMRPPALVLSRSHIETADVTMFEIDTESEIEIGSKHDNPTLSLSVGDGGTGTSQLKMIVDGQEELMGWVDAIKHAQTHSWTYNQILLGLPKEDPNELGHHLATIVHILLVTMYDFRLKDSSHSKLCRKTAFIVLLSVADALSEGVEPFTRPRILDGFVLQLFDDHFLSERPSRKQDSSAAHAYEILISRWLDILGSGDDDVIESSFRQAWFVLSLVTKSIILKLWRSG
eukprot:234256_1